MITQDSYKVLIDKIVCSYETCEVSERGSSLLGKRPDIAPKAYEIVIYPPAPEHLFARVYHLRFANSFKHFSKFLLAANGLSLDVGDKKIFGIWPSERCYPLHPHNYPSNFLSENDDRVNTSIIIGFHSKDNAFLRLSEDGSIVLVSRNSGYIKAWGSLHKWIEEYAF